MRKFFTYIQSELISNPGTGVSYKFQFRDDDDYLHMVEITVMITVSDLGELQLFKSGELPNEHAIINTMFRSLIEIIEKERVFPSKHELMLKLGQIRSSDEISEMESRNNYSVAIDI